jgi:hypothetical protein
MRVVILGWNYGEVELLATDEMESKSQTSANWGRPSSATTLNATGSIDAFPCATWF